MVYLKCLYIKIWSFLWYRFFNTNGNQLIDKKIFNKIYNYLNARNFKKNYLRVTNYSEEYLLNVNKRNEDKFFNKFSQIKEGEMVYLYALYGAAGDYACAFVYIKDIINYLKKKKCEIMFIGNKKLKDILKLCNIYRDVKIEYTKFYMYGINESCAKFLLKGDINIGDKTLICINPPSNSDLFLKNPIKYGGINVNYRLSKSIQNKFRVDDAKILCNKSDYLFDNVNKKKINNIIKDYSDKGGLIICNFENKSFRAYKRDEIKFSKYIENLEVLGKKYNLKFIVNSVYNHEKLYNGDNILITRLNFQEIIWLAENDKIQLFISERNGLNDVFYVFYPKINQIIYYPDCYYTGVCIDKYLYNDIYMKNLKIDALYAHYLCGKGNIIQDYRKNYFKSIENNIMGISDIKE